MIAMRAFQLLIETSKTKDFLTTQGNLKPFFIIRRINFIIFIHHYWLIVEKTI
tara:strand:- start:368 stop:526 length:159 start_codon:yes stop_codon:yes gene_type:complete